ncbi:MAG: hypothetical protein CL677_09800, partial [Bdellovibrionaceae bacterium]|nr:hypothetical protein [Pseudobdellovibrionaceae bacterium]
MFKRSLLSLILVSVIPLLALSIWYYFDTVNSLNEKSHSIVVQKNQMDQQILRLVMAEQIANVHDWSNQSIIRVSLSINRPEALVSILEALKQNHLLFESLQVFSADGKPFAGNFDAGVGLKRISASIQTLRDNPVRQTVFAFDGKIVIAEQISDKLDTVLGVLVGTIDISKLSSFLTLNGERIGGNFESTRSYFESNGKPVSLTNAETRDFAGKGGFTSCSPFLDMIGHLQVCSQQDRNESKSAIKRVTGAFLVSAVFSLILLIVIINLVSRW